MKDEYIYCAVNDCNINKGYSKCCLYCDNTKCPERCNKKEISLYLCAFLHSFLLYNTLSCKIQYLFWLKLEAFRILS